MKKFRFIALSVMLLSLFTPVSITAAENTSDEATSLFDELKDKYDGLSENYGNITSPDSVAFNGYLESIQSNKANLNIEQSLNEIKNFDFSSENNKYIDNIWKNAQNDSESVKKDAKALESAFTEKYAKAEAEAKAREEATRSAGKAEYDSKVGEYESMKNSNSSKIGEVQSKYQSYLSGYQNAAAGGNSLAGNFTKYGLPTFDDKVLNDIGKLLGIDAFSSKEQEQAKKQTQNKESSTEVTKKKVYTSNAYQAGLAT